LKKWRKKMCASEVFLSKSDTPGVWGWWGFGVAKKGYY